MSDIICRPCGEPWDQHYLAHEALFEHPGQHAPAYLVKLHEELLRLDDAEDRAGNPPPKAYELGGRNLQLAVIKGEGCPACWDDPLRATNDEDAQIEALRHNLFDSGWDGDPAELF